MLPITTIWDIPPALGAVINVVYSVLLGIAVFVIAYGIFKFVLQRMTRRRGRRGV